MQTKPVLIAVALVFGTLGLAVAWWVAGTTDIVTANKIQRLLAEARDHPWAPGTVINLGFGVSGIRTADFVAGTVVGMTPGLLLVSIVGDRLAAFITEPTFGEVGVLVPCMAAYPAFVFGMQVLLSRHQRQRQKPA